MAQLAYHVSMGMKLWDYEVKNVPLSSKVMLEKDDYNTLVTAAKKYVVQVKKESKPEKALAAAEKMIAGLKAKITELTQTIASLTQQLDQYRSIREQHGLGHLLGRKRAQRQERDTR